MSASYPGAIKTFTTLIDDVDDVLASHQNDPNLEITAIETELGTDPAGTVTDVKTRLAQSLAGDGDLDFASSTELTISGGAITITQNWHRVDTESDAASDDLYTINGAASDGYVLFIRPEHPDRTVVIAHAAGNIKCTGGGNIELDDTEDFAILIWDNNLSLWLAQQGQPAVAGIPSGSIFAYGGSSAPTGYLLCDGSAVSRTTYATLFAVIGTAFGTGDGSTTFNLPDLRGRVGLGKDNMGGSSANRVTDTQADNLGQGSGAESHNHGQTSGGLGIRADIGGGSSIYIINTLGSMLTDTKSNVTPYQTVNYIIKT